MNDLIQKRYATAHAAAVEAESALQEFLLGRSQKILDKLLRKSPREQLRALETASDEFLKIHRRELVQAIRSSKPDRAVVSHSTSNWYERWRARLPYQVFRTAITVSSAMIAVALFVVAYLRTPQYVVTLDIQKPVQIKAIWPDGKERPLDVFPGQRFVLMRLNGDNGTVRGWLSGEGYVHFRVSTSLLRKAG